MNDPPSIHTQVQNPLRVSSPRGPYLPMQSRAHLPLPCLFYHEPQGDPQPLSSLYIKDHPGPHVVQARRWSLMESADMSVAGLGPGVWREGQSPPEPHEAEAWPE